MDRARRTLADPGQRHAAHRSRLPAHHRAQLRDRSQRHPARLHGGRQFADRHGRDHAQRRPQRRQLSGRRRHAGHRGQDVSGQFADRRLAGARHPHPRRGRDQVDRRRRRHLRAALQAIREGAEGDLMTVIATETAEGLIRWRYLPWALAAIAAMIAVIVAGNIWLLDFVHVFSSLLWTGVDLFMGFVLGPILRRVDLSVRREIVRRLTPRTLFLMPTVSIISGTTGWFLAVQLGYTALDWPAYWWVAAALILVTLMTIQGLGFLTPVTVDVGLQLQDRDPDMRKISSWMRWFFYAVALQGLIQVAIIVVMTRFRAGI